MNSRNKDGWSPLMHALRYDQAQNASLLIAKGADPKTALPNGWTALHFAIEYGQPENARQLIAKGALKDVRTPEGKSPLDLAKAKGYGEIVRLLGGSVDLPAPASETVLSPKVPVRRDGDSWIPGFLGQIIPPRPGAKVLSSDNCRDTSTMCSVRLELPGTKADALSAFKRDLMAQGWQLDKAIGSPAENGSLGTADLWGLLNVTRNTNNITILFLSDRKTAGKTQVDITFIRRSSAADMAAFVKQIPRVIINPTLPKERFETPGWAFTLKTANWCGSTIEKEMGFGAPKYTYTAQGEGMDLLKIQIHLEARDQKAIKERFMKIAIRLRDKQGNLYSPVLAGTSTGDYFNLSQGGRQSALVPMQPQSDMDWVFALPRGTLVEALLWPDLDAISLMAR